MNRSESIRWILETVNGSHFAVRWLFQGQISGSSRWDQEAQSGAWNILPVWSRLSHFSGRHRAGEFSFDSYKWETEARLHFTADIQSFQLSWSICLQLIFYVAEEKAAGKCKPRRHDCLNLKMSGTKWRTTVETWKTMLTLCWNRILTNTVMSVHKLRVLRHLSHQVLRSWGLRGFLCCQEAMEQTNWSKAAQAFFSLNNWDTNSVYILYCVW